MLEHSPGLRPVGVYQELLRRHHDNADDCLNCAYGGSPGNSAHSPYGFVLLPDGFLAVTRTADRTTSLPAFKTMVHEVGHALAFRDAATGTGHADCTGTQVMCGQSHIDEPANPTTADLAGLTVPVDRYPERYPRRTLRPNRAPDFQVFGLWGAPAAGSLARFGVEVTRTLNVPDRGTAAGIVDRLAFRAYVRGTADAGPAPGTGTATWEGPFLGVHTGRAEPVTGTATLTADLAALATLELGLADMERTDENGQRWSIRTTNYELQRRGNTWTDVRNRADARFYAGDDAAAFAAGHVNDETRELVGAWGGSRQ